MAYRSGWFSIDTTPGELVFTSCVLIIRCPIFGGTIVIKGKKRVVRPALRVFVIGWGILLSSIASLQAQSVIVVSDPTPNGTVATDMMGSQFEWWSFQTKFMWNNRKADLLESWKSVPVRYLRYPGGTAGDHYVWDSPSSSHGYNASQANDFYIPLYDADPANISFYQKNLCIESEWCTMTEMKLQQLDYGQHPL